MAYNEHIFDDLQELSYRFSGELYTDRATRIMYATDASAYREIPQAVAMPKNKDDIIELVEFAKKHNTSLIPRTAGTSLAGQVVGGGVVVDVGRYMNRILEVNHEEKWVRVEPGAVLDELNQYLKSEGLFFSPETSTSNRCMIGGMVGNNSCGAHSLVYGSTRDHLLAVKAILSDSSEVEFCELTLDEFDKKCLFQTLEGKLYRRIKSYLSNPANREEVSRQFPDPEIKRRNTGYAIDQLMAMEPFVPKGPKFNFSTLLAGSEGTLAFFTELKLHLDPLPPPVKGLLCVHFDSLEDALHGNLVALKHKPVAVELMDRTIMEMSKKNIAQNKNRFFIQGDPEAILIIEFTGDSLNEVSSAASSLENDLKKEGFGTYFPLITGEDIHKVWGVRKAGLGLLSNIPGDAKPVAVVEDTAVKPEDLPAYIGEFKKILDNYGLKCAFNAHIGTGELHLRPILNLKDKEDVKLFRKMAEEIARLVKKFNGSLSGEHGDGRLRGEFLSFMIGEQNYAMLREIKRTWDPENIFNHGKIFETPAMNTSLRYEDAPPVLEVETMLDFSSGQGYLANAERCNGSGDCRKSASMGGAMCPSFQATKDEKDSTRARANMLREMITRSKKQNPFHQREVYKVLDLCLSCKACKSECPSNVDMAKLKAEFLYQYFDKGKIPFKVRAMAHYPENYKLASMFPGLSNFFLKNRISSRIIKSMLGIAPDRSLPLLHSCSLDKWLAGYGDKLLPATESKGSVYFFADEFTRYNDAHVGILTIKLLTSLGYEVMVPGHGISGRTFISKGMLKKARACAVYNVNALKDLINENTPLIGIEPSTILSFRDEYPDLLRGDLKKSAQGLARSALLIEEFICREARAGNILPGQFTNEKMKMRVHGHCHQKAIGSVGDIVEMLSLPDNYSVDEIASGCCGMAGSFGYEKDHYALSMQIGELVLFPEVRKTLEDSIVVASGTSCRQQIKDGTGRTALHPVEVLFNAVRKEL